MRSRFAVLLVDLAEAGAQQAAEKGFELASKVRQGLKPYPFFRGFYGTTKVVPFYKTAKTEFFPAAGEVVPFYKTAKTEFFSAIGEVVPFYKTAQSRVFSPSDSLA